MAKSISTRRSDTEKRFIVEMLACFRTPSQVVRAVKERFGVEISPQAVESYDPTKNAGAKLSDEYRQLFVAARTEYRAQVENIGVAHMKFRLDVMQQTLEQSRERGNHAMTLQILELAAKECGGIFTNRREVAAKGGAPLVKVEQRYSLTTEDLEGFSIEELNLLEKAQLRMIARIESREAA